MRAAVFIGMGSNHDPRNHLASGSAYLREILEDPVFSGCYRSESRMSGADYLNMAVFGYTYMSWDKLNVSLKDIEKRCGRVRKGNDECSLDLDLLWYDGIKVENRLPHPDLWLRSYVAVPVAELCCREKMAMPGDPPDGAWLRKAATELIITDFRI